MFEKITVSLICVAAAFFVFRRYFRKSDSSCGTSSCGCAPKIKGDRPKDLRSHRANYLGLPIFTLWICVFSVGIFGLVATYARPKLSPLSGNYAAARLIDIELMPEHFSPVLQPESLSEIPNALELPTKTPVPDVKQGDRQVAAEPQVAVVPSQKTDSEEGSIRSSPGITTLIYGQGYAKQPAPLYPYAAIRRRQVGEVSIVFKIDKAGRVAEAAVSKSSTWPLLDESALNTVRNLWKFPSGAAGQYIIPFAFELK